MNPTTPKAVKVLLRLVLGAGLATVAIYLWGMMYAKLIPYKIVSPVYDKEAFIRLLQANFPESGTYTLPTSNDNDEAVEELLETGPVATLDVLSKSDISLKLKEFQLRIVQIFLAACLVGWVIRKARPTISSYRLRVIFVALIGLAAAVFNDLADPIWAYHSWRWSLAKAVYHITSWTVAGLVLANDWFTASGTDSLGHQKPAQN